jgi:hypothetical protein
MTRYTLTSRSTDATATEGWSGVDDRELATVEAAIAWFAAMVIEMPMAIHFLTTKSGHELARFMPLEAD